ncbi:MULTISPECIES: hypothetical protein [unclassified Bradyrhizobium]|uniref:hypothetical protein n=1 Tax=unclassified Bradyrhizobium TaxID=2631580 RepID=UPI00211EC4D3|nr:MULTISPECIES: hypothetical protein [unclassified Bradyrhizobium]
MATAASHARATSAVIADAVAGAASVSTHANPINLRIFLTGTSLLLRTVNICRTIAKTIEAPNGKAVPKLLRGLPRVLLDLSARLVLRDDRFAVSSG